MAITNYTELKKAIVDSSFRDDLDLLIPQFIATAELRMFNNPDEQLKIQEMDVFLSQTVNTKKFSLPTRFLAIESISLVDGNGTVPLIFKPSASLPRKNTTGRPQFFTINGGQIELDTAPDTDYQIDTQYVEQPEPLSVSVPTNSLLTKNFNIYLFGSLAALYLHVQDIESATLYNAQFMQEIQGANRLAEYAGYNPVVSVSLPPHSFTP